MRRLQHALTSAAKTFSDEKGKAPPARRFRVQKIDFQPHRHPI
jgi:hypothetical protein